MLPPGTSQVPDWIKQVGGSDSAWGSCACPCVLDPRALKRDWGWLVSGKCCGPACRPQSHCPSSRALHTGSRGQTFPFF